MSDVSCDFATTVAIAMTAPEIGVFSCTLGHAAEQGPPRSLRCCGFPVNCHSAGLVPDQARDRETVFFTKEDNQAYLDL